MNVGLRCGVFPDDHVELCVEPGPATQAALCVFNRAPPVCQDLAGGSFYGGRGGLVERGVWWRLGRGDATTHARSHGVLGIHVHCVAGVDAGLGPVEGLAVPPVCVPLGDPDGTFGGQGGDTGQGGTVVAVDGLSGALGCGAAGGTERPGVRVGDPLGAGLGPGDIDDGTGSLFTGFTGLVPSLIRTIRTTLTVVTMTENTVMAVISTCTGRL